jgi:hypothetical protein
MTDMNNVLRIPGKLNMDPVLSFPSSPHLPDWTNGEFCHLLINTEFAQKCQKYQNL